MFLSLNVQAEDWCTNTSERFVIPPTPLAAKLYDVAKTIEMGAWDDGHFWQERFYYLGKVVVAGHPLYVTYIDTTWGASSWRGTQRLIFFTREFKAFAQYYAVSKPTVVGSILDFPKGERKKTAIDVSSGLPQWLNDGDDHVEIHKYKIKKTVTKQ